MTKLYYEAHVTIEPVFDERRCAASEIAKRYRFRLAELLMQKRQSDSAERSRYDTFMTANGHVLEDIENRTRGLIEALREAGFKVWRYKIEDTLVDSRFRDSLGLLT